MAGRSELKKENAENIVVGRAVSLNLVRPLIALTVQTVPSIFLDCLAWHLTQPELGLVKRGV